MTTLQAFQVTVTLPEVFERFSAPFDAVRNQREQRDLLESFVVELEQQRKKECQQREYTQAQVSKTMLQVVREELKQIAIRFENKRQETENKCFRDAASVIKAEVTENERQKVDGVFAECKTKERLQQELHVQQQQHLSREIAKIPIPRSRYTKGTLELRHAEKSLSQQQDYFNATIVRSKTKRLEAEEDRATRAEFERKMQHKRDCLAKQQDFENKRLFEDLKQRRAVGKRENKAALKLVNDRVSYLDAGMTHGHAMNLHKIKGTTHNVALEPRKLSKETQRGTTFKEFKIGKPFLAIPSLSSTHVFDVKKNLVETARPQTANPVPNFRDPKFRMTARLEACRPVSRGLEQTQDLGATSRRPSIAASQQSQQSQSRSRSRPTSAAPALMT